MPLDRICSVVIRRSPDDESEDKLPFYVLLGILEVWIIDRDTKSMDLYVLAGDSYVQHPARDGGWYISPFTGIEMRVGRPGKLAIRMGADDSREFRNCRRTPIMRG
jgi:hypothetical protein